MPIKLSKISTGAPKKLDKEKTKSQTQKLLIELDALQNLFFATQQKALLIVVQGMDASGKDGVVANVFGAFNPMGVRVVSFKKPTEEEMAHDFLWRIHGNAPRKGIIQVFNRSHYEDVLIQRVHKWIDEKTVKQRMIQINNFEEMLEFNGTKVLKFYLHISQEEQQHRLTERMNTPEKNWKYNAQDFEESKFWSAYMKAYEDAIDTCSPKIPWHIIPADHNWYKEYLIASEVVNYLKSLKMSYPTIKK
ncbi:MAG: PPK2 family polyphosphate kinase [Bacteroidota bacterium]